MKISKINWLSLPAKEAEIKILDGLHTTNVFSQPCEYDVDQNIDDYLRPQFDTVLR